jgi:hypothetical protein
MSIWSVLFGGGQAIASPVEAVGNVFDKLFTSDEEKLQAQAVLEKLRQHPGELQVELNKIEGGSAPPLWLGPIWGTLYSSGRLPCGLPA